MSRNTFSSAAELGVSVLCEYSGRNRCSSSSPWCLALKTSVLHQLSPGVSTRPARAHEHLRPRLAHQSARPPGRVSPRSSLLFKVQSCLQARLPSRCFCLGTEGVKVTICLTLSLNWDLKVFSKNASCWFARNFSGFVEGGIRTAVSKTIFEKTPGA